MADPNFQLLDSDDDQIVGANDDARAGNLSSKTTSPDKTPMKNQQLPQTSSAGNPVAHGSGNAPINQAATPTTNLINTAIAMGASANGNNSLPDSDKLVRPDSECSDSVRRSNRIPGAKAVVKYGGVSYR